MREETSIIINIGNTFFVQFSSLSIAFSLEIIGMVYMGIGNPRVRKRLEIVSSKLLWTKEMWEKI